MAGPFGEGVGGVEVPRRKPPGSDLGVKRGIWGLTG